jgi:short-subunit dehydrogenase
VELHGKRCLVTGASSGIGRALAVTLGRRGARLILTGRDGERLAEVARTTGGETILADLGARGGPARVAAAAGDVDVLVNNAGLGWAGSFADMDGAEIERLVLVNLVAPTLLARALLPGMLARGRGHIVNVASVAGHLGVKEEAVYAATKAGLIALSESLQQELAGSPVHVTLVSPGVIDTPLFERRGHPYDRRWPRPLPAERIADAIADAIERDKPHLVLQRWLALPIRLHGIAPSLYRRLARRWG